MIHIKVIAIAMILSLMPLNLMAKSMVDNTITLANVHHYTTGLKKMPIRLIMNGYNMDTMRFSSPKSADFNKAPDNQFFSYAPYLDLSSTEKENLFNDGSKLIISRLNNFSNYNTDHNTEKTDIVLIIQRVKEKQCLSSAQMHGHTKIPKLNIAPDVQHIWHEKNIDKNTTLDTHGLQNGCFKGPDNINYYLQILYER